MYRKLLLGQGTNILNIKWCLLAWSVLLRYLWVIWTWFLVHSWIFF